MALFGTNKISCQTTILLTAPDYSQKNLSHTIHMETKQISKENLRITLVQRESLLMNDQTPEQIVDILMMELGNSLYPMILQVDKEGRIDSVLDFNDLRYRWLRKADELMRSHKTDEFEKYVLMAKNNMANEHLYLDALKRDTFFQLFFSGIGNKVIEIDCVNFPKQSKKTTYYGLLDKINEYRLLPAILENGVQSLNGTLAFEKNTKGFIKNIDAHFHLLTDDYDSYTKQVIIKTI